MKSEKIINLNEIKNISFFIRNLFIVPSLHCFSWYTFKGKGNYSFFVDKIIKLYNYDEIQSPPCCFATSFYSMLSSLEEYDKVNEKPEKIKTTFSLPHKTSDFDHFIVEQNLFLNSGKNILGYYNSELFINYMFEYLVLNAICDFTIPNSFNIKRKIFSIYEDSIIYFLTSNHYFYETIMISSKKTKFHLKKMMESKKNSFILNFNLDFIIDSPLIPDDYIFGLKKNIGDGHYGFYQDSEKFFFNVLLNPKDCFIIKINF